MILITLGSQKFQFDRLLQFADDLIETGIITDKVYAQSGYSNYLPKYYRHDAFIDRERLNELMSESTAIITHGGTGIITTALKMDKKVIVVPRKCEFGEHVDNHQYQIVTNFQQQGYILSADDLDSLRDAYLALKNWQPNRLKGNNSEYLTYLKSIID